MLLPLLMMIIIITSAPAARLAAKRMDGHEQLLESEGESEKVHSCLVSGLL